MYMYLIDIDNHNLYFTLIVNSLLFQELRRRNVKLKEVIREEAQRIEQYTVGFFITSYLCSMQYMCVP